MTKLLNKVQRVARKVLVFGIGGSAQEIVARAINQILEKISTLRCFQCRLFDTDLKSEYGALLRPYFIQLNTVRAELIRKNPREFPIIANELRLEKIPTLTSTQGTGQFISQGKLIFAASQKEVIETIRNAVKPLLLPQLVQNLSELGIFLNDERIYIFIIRSIGGGMGSSASEEIPWIVEREMLRIMEQRSRFILTDIMIRPEPFESCVEDRFKLLSNAGVSIHTKCEYNNPDLPSRIITYGDDPDLQVEIGGRQVADINFLVSNRNLTAATDTIRGSGMLSLEEVYELCAEYLVLQYSPMMTEFYSQYANIEHESKKKVRGQPAIFSGFGILELCFSAQMAKRWLIEQLGIEVLKRLKGGE